ncbi:MAG: TonB-dependent receptor [Acidobacteriaceae bacterium]|nr:TonB-dependent receptor [Acidobacteriaceae bacterium]
MKSNLVAAALFCLCASVILRAQDPVGAIEGRVSDTSSAPVTAHVLVQNLDTGLQRETNAAQDGFFRVPLLPIGHYRVSVAAPHLATFVQEPVTVDIGESVRLSCTLAVAAITSNVNVTGDAPPVDSSTNVLGAVVTGREILDLPLNGRNFTQLGLLQAGAAPLTSGLIEAGGPLRQGETYAVNGDRPEENMYTVDGAQNMNRMDSGYALKIPVDAIAEFRILTQTAPPEYGGTGGATTAVVTRSGSNELHGSLYEFLRNDRLDTRNFFSTDVQPLKQNQFGATAGGPIQHDRLFFFGYYEGFRNRQGITTSAVVPSMPERSGDFSALGKPLLNFAAGGTHFAGNKLPFINPIAANVLNLYPLPNAGPNDYIATLVGTNNYDQAGLRLDYNASSHDQFFVRGSFSGGYDNNPVSVRGTPVPGFPTRDDIKTDSAGLSETHTFSPTLTNSFRADFLRYIFLFDQRLNQTPPSALGFGYSSANVAGQGLPFFNLLGYSPVGGAITGPRNSVQNSFEEQDGLSWVKGSHSAKLGADLLRTQLNMFQAIAPNAFFIFASTFPTNDAVANLELGAPVTFYQGLGDFHRGLRDWSFGAYAQDEWRITSRLTLNYGVRYESVQPITEVQNRVNGFVPGLQSVVYPNAPKGILFPGDPGIGAGIARNDNAFMPRLGFAWDPFGDGKWAIRSSYGVFYDQFQNGPGVASQVPISALPWAQFNQYSGPAIHSFANPYIGNSYPAPNTFTQPATVFGIDPRARAPYVQNWNFGIQRSLFTNLVIEARYVGSKGTHLPRNIEANPAVYRPGATAQNADQRRIYAGCPPGGNGACQLSTVALLSDITNSTYEAGQLSVTRGFASGLGVNFSYWYSKSLDYLSSMNMAGASSVPLAGANDLAQNPLDLKAEHGPSLFDARHRVTASVSYQMHIPKSAVAPLRAILGGWQANLIASHNSPTPFTVYDSTNVSLQANSPPISGYPASRPNLVGDPNSGPRTVQDWVNIAAFQRLNPVTQAGQFGNAGRNIARGPAFTDFDASLTRTFRLRERTGLEFRAESFNIANHPNFGLPVADLNSPSFGQILTAGSPRLMQFALKLMF